MNKHCWKNTLETSMILEIKPMIVNDSGENGFNCKENLVVSNSSQILFPLFFYSPRPYLSIISFYYFLYYWFAYGHTIFKDRIPHDHGT